MNCIKYLFELGTEINILLLKNPFKMQLHLNYFLYSAILSISFVTLSFYLTARKKKRSPHNIQKMIKDLENKIINA